MERWLGCVGVVGTVALVAACGGKIEQVGPGGLDAGGPVIQPGQPHPGFPDAGFVFDVSITPIGAQDGGFDVSTGPGDAFDGPDGDFPDTNGTQFDTGIPDAGVDSFLPDGGWSIAAHYPMPTVIDFDGPILSGPVFTAVTFPTYDLTTEAQQFVATVGSTSYWTAAVGEYGVGPATANTPVVLTESAPASIDDSVVQTWLAGKLDGSAANAAFGTPTDQSVYVIFYPTGTTVTLEGLSSCVEGGFGGYHNSIQLSSGPFSGLNVAYAVVPECSFDATTQEQLTESASHELIEAVTDPLPLTETPAYVQTDQNDIVWEVILGGGEIADMCAQNPNADFVPASFSTPVQRVWSNEHALAGHDPCQPSETGVTYFNAIANLNAMVNLTYMGQVIPTEGLSIPLNKSQTVEVDLYSDGPIADWTVSADDLSDFIGGGPYLEFSWDQTTGNNGTKLHLTITPVASSPYGGQPFEIVSQTGQLANYWLGFVGQP
jgi:hypothetical protein